MKHRYRISPEGRGPEPTDAEVLRYRDSRKLLYNYQRAHTLLHRRPIYKDPKAFLALLLIVLLAWFISERVHKQPPSAPGTEQPVPGTP